MYKRNIAKASRPLSSSVSWASVTAPRGTKIEDNSYTACTNVHTLDESARLSQSHEQYRSQHEHRTNFGTVGNDQDANEAKYRPNAKSRVSQNNDRSDFNHITYQPYYQSVGQFPINPQIILLAVVVLTVLTVFLKWKYSESYL